MTTLDNFLNELWRETDHSNIIHLNKATIIGKKHYGSLGEVSKALRYLVEKGYLQWLDQFRLKINIKKDQIASVRTINIIHIVKRNPMLKPAEIHKKYEAEYGLVNAETLTRKVRQLAIEGLIERSNNKYYVKDSRKLGELNKWI